MTCKVVRNKQAVKINRPKIDTVVCAARADSSKATWVKFDLATTVVARSDVKNDQKIKIFWEGHGLYLYMWSFLLKLLDTL